MPYEGVFEEVAEEVGVEFCVLYEITRRESQFNPLSIGGVGEYGLMQIHPATWKEVADRLNVFDPFDPYSNVKVGAHYFRWVSSQMQKLGRPELIWALAAYNWGIGNVTRLLKSGRGWDDVRDFTRRYAAEIAASVESCRLARDRK
jgi:soluble lytic murein transglycosylase-like protein